MAWNVCASLLRVQEPAYEHIIQHYTDTERKNKPAEPLEKRPTTRSRFHLSSLDIFFFEANFTCDSKTKLSARVSGPESEQQDLRTKLLVRTERDTLCFHIGEQQ